MNKKNTLIKSILASAIIGLSSVSFGQTLLQEGFEGATFPPANWTTIDVDGNVDDNWQMFDNAAGFTPTIVAAEGTQYAGSLSWLNTPFTPDNWLITPPLTITDAATRLNFKATSNYGDYMGVYISTTGTNVADFGTAVFEQEFPTTWESIQIPLGAYVGQQIYIAFRHFNSNDFFVMAVDDIKVAVPDANDIVLNQVIWGSVGPWDIIPYTNVPQAQVTAIEFSGIISNDGSADQSDITFNVNSGSYTGVSDVLPLLASERDTFDIITGFTPATTLGDNIIDFNASSSAVDAIPANNTLPSKTVTVTNTEYGIDLGVVDAAENIYNQGAGYEVGNTFNIYTNAVLTAAKVNVSAFTDPGTLLYVKLYEMDTSVSGAAYLDYFVEIFANVGRHTFAASEGDTWISIPLETPQALEAGKSYTLVVGSEGGVGTNDFVCNTSGISAAGHSAYFDYNDGKMYYTTSTPMVRMDFGPVTPTITSNDADNVSCIGSTINLTSNVGSGVQWSLDGNAISGATSQTYAATQAGTYTATVGGLTSNALALTFNDCTGINEGELTNINIYPNPTTGTFTITNTENVNSIELVDQLGRKLASWKVNQVVMNLDVTKIAQGNYTLVFKGDNTSTVKQVQIAK